MAGLDQVQVPVVPTCVPSTAEPLAARAVKWDLVVEKSKAQGMVCESTSARTNVQWEQGGGWFQTAVGLSTTEPT